MDTITHQRRSIAVVDGVINRRGRSVINVDAEGEERREGFRFFFCARARRRRRRAPLGKPTEHALRLRREALIHRSQCSTHTPRDEV